PGQTRAKKRSRIVRRPAFSLLFERFQNKSSAFFRSPPSRVAYPFPKRDMRRTLQSLTRAFSMDGRITAGRVEWIGVSSAPRASIQALDEVELIAGKGLAGDHHAKERESHRQVTLIQHEHLPKIADGCGLPQARPESLRRNLVISGIELADLQDRTFAI